MTRFIMSNNLKDPKDISKFDYEGYRFSSKLSSDNAPVFLRKL